MQCSVSPSSLACMQCNASSASLAVCIQCSVSPSLSMADSSYGAEYEISFFSQMCMYHLSSTAVQLHPYSRMCWCLSSLVLCDLLPPLSNTYVSCLNVSVLEPVDHALFLSSHICVHVMSFSLLPFIHRYPPACFPGTPIAIRMCFSFAFFRVPGSER
jgi:hypothetical protein